MTTVSGVLPTLYGLELDELKNAAKAGGFPAFRGAQLYEWLYQKKITAFSQAKNLPADFVKYLEKEFTLTGLCVESTHPSQNGESIKFLFRTKDGKFIESVLIEQMDRRTVCVSTQNGCKIGCSFCASGKGKFGRNLTAGEIVEQIVWIEHLTAAKITNIVFMGMGEPLDNFDATMKALRLFQDLKGFGFGSRRITVSTSGVVPKILEFVKAHEGRVRLSVSLHSSKDETRNVLVPINRKYPIRVLMEALRQVADVLKREITFEYTLIEGVNDSDEEAKGVVRLAKPLDAKVNIIPYNPIQGETYRTPSAENLEHFRRFLENHEVRVIVRNTAGRDVNGACGQLRLITESSEMGRES